MASPLASLFDLRRDAEQQAASALERAGAARAATEAEQNRLAGCWRDALTAWTRERERPGAVPANAGQRLTSELYLAELDREVARTARQASEHRNGPLAAAVRAETEARAAFAQAHAALAAVAGLMERAQAEEAKVGGRRAEDSAGDLANAAFVRERGR